MLLKTIPRRPTRRSYLACLAALELDGVAWGEIFREPSGGSVNTFLTLAAAAFLMAAPAYSQSQKGLFAAWSLGDRIAAVASIAATLQVVALIWTILVMIRNGRVQLRAYIAIDGGFIQQNPDQTITFSVSVKNSGQTPAYDFRSWSRMEIATLPPFATRGEGEIASIVGPGSTTHFGGTINPGIGLLTAVSSNQQAIYAWGFVTYKDIFKRPRHFHYRCTMRGPPQTLAFPNGTKGIGWALRPDETGYDAN